MTERRVCVIHIGTHKTATTSQQYFLMQNAQTLRGKGLFFPSKGWYGVVPGHHALAWELLSKTDGPVLAEVLNEIESSQAPLAALSAEDFSHLHARPQALAALASALREIGYTPRILCYLRGQGAYAEAMYVEQLKRNAANPLASYIREIVNTGRFLIHPELYIEFQYTRLLRPFQEVFGEHNVLVRAYGGVTDLTRAYSDFLKSIGELGDIDLEPDTPYEVSQVKLNEGTSFVRLLGMLFTYLRPGQEVPLTAEEFAAMYAPDVPHEYLHQRFALLQRNDYRELLASVANDNLEIERSLGVHVPFQTEADIASPIDGVWAKALAERRALERCRTEWLKGTD